MTDQYLPFFITAPGESDLLFSAVVVFLILVAVGFGALYFTIQAIPDRLANGASKVQLQIVGLLGLLSLFTMNNAFWVAALLLAAVRIPDIVTPLREIGAEMRRQREAGMPPAEVLPAEVLPEEPPEPEPVAVREGQQHD
jgi:hypothetical protein